MEVSRCSRGKTVKKCTKKVCCTRKVVFLSIEAMLHWTIRNVDFQRNTALQCWNNVATIRNYVATMLERCVALKIVSCSRPLDLLIFFGCFLCRRRPVLHDFIVCSSKYMTLSFAVYCFSCFVCLFVCFSLDTALALSKAYFVSRNIGQ